jgi:nucleoside-diphosphate-sugar epimerase
MSSSLSLNGDFLGDAELWVRPSAGLAISGRTPHIWAMSETLLSFGHGYSASGLARLLLPHGWRVIGTTRSAEKAGKIAATGVTPLIWPGADVTGALEQATHVLVSAAPDAAGDPVLRELREAIAACARRFRWVGYLSTTGVYGNHDGDWVDEDSPLTPATERGKARVLAEAEWRAIAGLPLHIFRLAGIYGPGRGPFEKVRQGTARRIVKPGQVFSRIHVDDIAQVLAASIARPNAGRAYNLCDDDPAPPEDVIAHAAHLLGLPVPPAEDFAMAEMTPMARSFYAESKKVRNDRIKTELGVRLIHPDYRSGLAALLAAEDAAEVTGA